MVYFALSRELPISYQLLDLCAVESTARYVHFARNTFSESPRMTVSIAEEVPPALQFRWNKGTA